MSWVGIFCTDCPIIIIIIIIVIEGWSDGRVKKTFYL
jgi:hypothetical protein